MINFDQTCADVELIVDLAQRVEEEDNAIDWSYFDHINRDTAYRIMATHVLEMPQDPLMLSAVMTKLLVENMALHAKILGDKDGNTFMG